MTGANISEIRSPSCSGSICSEEEKQLYGRSKSLKEKRKNSSTSNSEKSDATYTKSDTKITVQRSSKRFMPEALKVKSQVSTPPKPVNSLRHLRSTDGIFEPNLFTSKHAQWLEWNDPVFTRRRSIEEQRLCRRLGNNSIQDQKCTIASFKRSLQLLGLKEKDLGLNNISKEKSESKLSRGRATPTFSTQLKQRSVSLTNLRNAVQESGLPTFQAIEKMHRDILSRAVYEEWYFKKQTENRIRKELEEDIQKKREEELEWIKFERKQRAHENFEKWKKRKAQFQKENQAEATSKDVKTSQYPKEKLGSEKAFDAWKAKKDKEMKAKTDIRKKLEAEEKNKKEKEEKKEAAEAVFKAWKQQVDEELKNKFKEKKKEEKIAEEKKENELKGKRENAKACYKQWKIEKDMEIKQNLKVKRSKSKQTAEEITMRKKEREYEASQAFEEWLDQIEEREVQKGKTQKNHLKNEVPPWYPA